MATKILPKKITLRKTKISELPPIKIVIEILVKVDSEVGNKAIKPSMFGITKADLGDQVSIEVKTIILAIVGNGKIKPKDLPDSFKLEEDLGYNDELLDFLHAALNNYVDHKNPGATFSQKEMDDCETVGDCVTLVETKIN